MFGKTTNFVKTIRCARKINKNKVNNMAVKALPIRSVDYKANRGNT